LYNHKNCSLQINQFLNVSSIFQHETGSTKNDEEEGDEGSDAEDLAEADEDETDLDLAWKMLDIARAIVEKQSVNTIEQVDILSTLADVALERGISISIYSF